MPAAVLIVNYRVYEHVDRALSSLRAFVRSGDEVVVVDHASDPDRLSALAARHPGVTFVPSAENPGFAAGINSAARASTAPYLLWLNPDAELTAPVVEVLERWLRDHPETAVVGPRVLDEAGHVDASARKFPDLTTAVAGRSTWLTRRFPNNWLSRRNLPARHATSAVDVDWLAGSCVMTRRAVFEQLGGLDEEFFLYWEDADYCRRAKNAGWRCVYLPTVSVRHLGGRSAAEDPAPAIRAFHRSAARLYAKHSGPAGRLLLPVIRPLLWLWGEWRAGRASRRGPRP